MYFLLPLLWGRAHAFVQLGVLESDPASLHQKTPLCTTPTAGQKKDRLFSASALLKCWQGVTECPSQCCRPARVSSPRMRKTMRTIEDELGCFPSWVTK